MYKTIRKISNVSGVKTYGDVVYYTVNNELIRDKKVIISGVEGYSFWFINDGIYFFDEDGNRHYQKDEIVDLVNFPFFTNSIFSTNIFCKYQFVRQNRKWQWILGIFDFKTMSLKKELPFKNFNVNLITENFAIGQFDSGILVGLDFIQEKKIWTLEEPVKKILGCFENNLILAAENNSVLMVNSFSGEILYKWSELPDFDAGSDYKGKIPNASNFVLDIESAKLIGVFHTYYFEIDLRSKMISFYQLKDELSKYGISDFRPFNDNPFTRKHLFLTTHTYRDDFPNVDLSSVIAFNRESKKVDWCHTFTESGLGTSIPQITTTHLYQKDTDNNLHIFERQGQLT